MYVMSVFRKQNRQLLLKSVGHAGYNWCNFASAAAYVVDIAAVAAAGSAAAAVAAVYSAAAFRAMWLDEI